MIGLATGSGDEIKLTGDHWRWVARMASMEFATKSGGSEPLPVRCRGPDKSAVQLMRIALEVEGAGGGCKRDEIG